LAPVVHVRGHSRITITDTVVEGGAAVLRGELRDRDLHTALPRREIRVEVRGAAPWRRAVRTGAGGVFRVRFPLEDRATVRLRFRGDTLYLGSGIGPISVNTGLPPVTLELSGPSQIRLAEPSVELSVAARASGAPATVDVTLRTGEGRRLARVRTGADVTTASVPTRALGPPGPVKIVATSDRGGHAALEAILRAPVHVRMEAQPPAAVVGDRISVQGDVSDPQGPISGAAVALRARGQAIASCTTDSQGRFSAALDSGGLGEGSVQLEAVHSPRVVWRESGRSPPVVIRLSAPKPLPALAVLVPAGLLLLVWGGRALRVRSRGQRPPAPAPPAAGMRPATAPGRGAALLRRPRSAIEGVVWDPFHERPVRGACLRLQMGGSDIQSIADRRGRFVTDAMQAGRYLASVSAHGYVTLSFPIDLPHRGELSGFRVDLEPVRALALRLWFERALPFSSPEKLPIVTPTELAADRQELTAAARAFEGAFYSGRTPDESSLDAIRSAPPGVSSG